MRDCGSSVSVENAATDFSPACHPGGGFIIARRFAWRWPMAASTTLNCDDFAEAGKKEVRRTPFALRRAGDGGSLADEES